MEIWKPVPSYPGIIASSFGRIKLPNTTANMPNGGVRNYITKPIIGSVSKSSKNAKHSYRNVFWKGIGSLKVHQLICEAFHGPKPFDKAVVIHLDENGLNNKPENLKWGTQKENLNATGFKEYCKSRTGENSPAIKGMRNKKNMNIFDKAIEAEYGKDFKLGMPLSDPLAITRRLTVLSNMMNGRGFRQTPKEPVKNAQGLTRGDRKRARREAANLKVSG